MSGMDVEMRVNGITTALPAAMNSDMAMVLTG